MYHQLIQIYRILSLMLIGCNIFVKYLNNQQTALSTFSYGYSGNDTKQNLISVLFTNEIVYSAGSVIVLYNVEKKRQRYFREHASLVKSICLYLNGFYIISASMKTKTAKVRQRIYIKR